MKLYFPVATLMAAAIGLGGCMQEADQQQTSGANPDSGASSESVESSSPDEHSAAKPEMNADDSSTSD